MRIGQNIEKHWKSWCLVAVALCLVLISICLVHRPAGDGRGKVSAPSYIKSMSRELNRLTYDNDWDSLLSTTHKIIDREMSNGETDTMMILCAALYNAQYFLFTENMDSLKWYLNFIGQYKDKFTRVRTDLESMLYMIEGYYKIKSENDFPGMVASLLKSYETDVANGFTGISALANIVSFYWVRSDVGGMVYAEKIRGIIADTPVSDYGKCIAYIAVAQMLSLSSDPCKAMYYADEAESIVESEHYVSYLPIIATIKGDIHSFLGETALAEEEYRTALSYVEYAEPSVVSLICLRLGSLYERRGQYEKAASLYAEGLDTAVENENMELKSELYIRLATVNDSLGKNSRALEFYRQYFRYFQLSKEWELSNLRMSYQQVLHDNEIKSKELDLLEANRRMIVIASGLVLFSVLLILLIVLYRKQRLLYRVLVDRYQYQLNLQKISDRMSARDGDSDLWNRVGKLMSEEKIYLRKNLSLESLAAEVGTNRTYLSKTINSFSGKNFSSYVDSYRIREAVRIIESSPKKAVIKQIAEAVGYNSTPVFYKAFTKEIGLAPGKYREEILRRIH